MIKIISNAYELLCAVPKNHPITVLNEAPLTITEMRINISGDGQPEVWIRGLTSMWFLADQCFVGPELDCQDYMSIVKQRR